MSAPEVDEVPAAPEGAPLIAHALVAVMADVGAIPKGREMSEGRFSYRYRSIEDVLPVVRAALVRHGVVARCTRVSDVRCEPVTSGRGASGYHLLATFSWAFTALDGSELCAESLGEAIDYGDKVANKAMTAAQKYALVQSLSIAYEDAADPDHVQPEPVRHGPPPEPEDPGVVWARETFGGAMRSLTDEQKSEVKRRAVEDGIVEGLTVAELKRVDDATRDELLALVERVAADPTDEGTPDGMVETREAKAQLRAAYDAAGAPDPKVMADNAWKAAKIKAGPIPQRVLDGMLADVPAPGTFAPLD